MSFKGFTKLAFKIFKYTLVRPLQRFNVENRYKKYLGPDAKKFMPAPRAIGAMSQNGGRPVQYPHLEGGKGFLSLRQRRLKALEAPANDSGGIVPTDTAKRSYSQTEVDDNLIREASVNLEVKKLVKLSPAPASELLSNRIAIESREKKENPTTDLVEASKPQRPLPTAVNLPLQDVAYMWHVDKVPPGRLSLKNLQELMVNKLADEEYWTPKMISEKYDIKEEYAEKVTKYMKHIRVVISPMQAKNLDLVGLKNPEFEATKHVIYYVDPALRNENDRKYDDTFLPEKENLPEEVKEVLEIRPQPRPYLKDPIKAFQIKGRRPPNLKQLAPENIKQIGSGSRTDLEDSDKK